MPTCLNLRELFGARFLIRHDEAYRGGREDAWLLVVPCTGRRGHFFPFGGRRIGVSSDRPGVTRKLKALGYCTLVQDGTDGALFHFDVDHFEQIASIMKPKRRRRMSAAQRAEGTERLKKVNAKRTAVKAPNVAGEERTVAKQPAAPRPSRQPAAAPPLRDRRGDRPKQPRPVSGPTFGKVKGRTSGVRKR
jgi:hypothetical protein